MRWQCIVNVCLTVVMLGPTLAVDRAKFRKCSQGSFCKRYRKYSRKIQEGGLELHALDPSSLTVEGHVVSAQVIHVGNGTDVGRLRLELALFRDKIFGRCGVLRLTLSEEAPLHPRFRIRAGDVVMEDLLPDKATLSQSAADEPGASIVTAEAPGDCIVTIRHQPLEVDISAEGHVLQRLNARHLLNFEQYRAKGSPAGDALVDATDVHADGLWEEFFDGHTDSKPRGPAAVGIDVTFADAPILTGLAEHATRLHLGTQKFDGNEPYRLFNLDVFEYEVDTPMALYGIVPLVTAVHHWVPINDSTSGDDISSTSAATTSSASGFMILNPSEGFVKVESPSRTSSTDTSTWWLFESGVLDMFAFVGPTVEAVLQQYHSVTGWPRMPPFASLGKHQSRWNYIDVKDVLDVDAGFDAHRIPYDVLWLDLEHTDGKKYFTWHPKHFSDAGVMLDELARKKRALVTIVDPHIKKDSEYSVWTKLNGLETFTRSADNSTFTGFCWPGDSHYPDFCNPSTRDAWAKLFSPDEYPHSKPNLYTWNDMNEPSVFNGPEVTMPRDNLHKCHDDGHPVEHRDMHNLYGLYHHAASVQGQLERTPGQRPFVLTRAFYAGTHRHGPIWTGDNMAKWSHLARSVPMLVSLSLCGLSFSGADVGGFNGDPDTELLIRWHQLGIWYPFYRAHAHLTTKRREPWLFGKKVTENIRDSVLTRYQMLPMWYTLAAEWVMQGLPMLRPLWYHNLTDRESFGHVDDHFLVGDAVVVRSIAEAGTRKVDVYLPYGEWFDFWEQAAAPRIGGQSFSLPAHPGHVPVFVSSGHILCKKMRPRRSALTMESDPYTVFIYGAAAKGRVYIDDGRSHDFQAGAFIYDELEFDGTAITSRPAKLPSHWEQARRAPSSPPPAGLRVERLVLIGLPRQPLSAQLVAGHGTESKDLQITVEQSAGGSLWVASVRDPAVQLGPPNAWSISLLF